MKPILMHEYKCPKCGFRWRQENRFPQEMCLRCGGYVPAGKSQMRLAPEPTNDRLGLKWRDE